MTKMNMFKVFVQKIFRTFAACSVTFYANGASRRFADGTLKAKDSCAKYKIARGQGCSPIEALEEWDLLTDEVIMKIQAEYNQLIDIELPPPPTMDA